MLKSFAQIARYRLKPRVLLCGTNTETGDNNMQDRYAGDAGDYGKIGLLKCLQAHGFSIGVNWYRVPMLDVEKKKDGSFKQDDGKYLIPDSIRECDPPLADILAKIAKGERSVVALQEADLIPNAVYFDEYLTVDGRREWCERAKRLFADVDLVFMDPDNGLLVKFARLLCYICLQRSL